MKIISFNVGTTHLMHFNKRVLSPIGETLKEKTNRSKLVKFNILSSLAKEKPDILCLQEGFTEVLPDKYSHLSKIGLFELKHGPIAGYNSSFLATYLDTKKYDYIEDTDFNKRYGKKYFNMNRAGTKFPLPCRTQIFIITDKKTNEETIIVNLHGTGIPEIEKRSILLNFLSNYLNEVYPQYDIVMVGDFNTNLQRRKGDDEEIEFAKDLRNKIFSNFDIFPKDDKQKSSYHRFIRNPDMTFSEKSPSERYDTLDYCLVKKKMGKDVKVERLPKNFNKKEVPYKLDKTDNKVKPNFDVFPSDHTLNIFTLKKRRGFLGYPTIKSRRIIKTTKRARSNNNKHKGYKKKNTKKSTSF